MSTICNNQLIFSGDRTEMFNLFVSSEFNYKNYRIFQISHNIFTLFFDTDRDLPKDTIVELSKQFPTIGFQILYAEKTMNDVGILIIKNGSVDHTKVALENKLDDFTRKKDFFLSDIIKNKKEFNFYA